MRFTVHPDVFSAFPDMRIAMAVARGIDNAAPRGAVEDEWRREWEGAQAAAQYGNAQSHPRVSPWRERMKAIGVSGKQFPSSIEALLRRAMKGGEPFHINPLVDFYNAVSLRHIVPAGGFDLAHIHGTLELRMSRAGDHFQALDDEAPVFIPPGEVAYADGDTVLTRHFVWRQSREGLIVPETQDVVLISEVLGEVGDGVAERVLADFQEGLNLHFGATPVGKIVGADEPSFDSQ